MFHTPEPRVITVRQIGIEVLCSQSIPMWASSTRRVKICAAVMAAAVQVCAERSGSEQQLT